MFPNIFGFIDSYIYISNRPNGREAAVDKLHVEADKVPLGRWSHIVVSRKHQE